MRGEIGASRIEPTVLLVTGAVALVASAIGAKDMGTWWMEVAPALIAAPILVATYRRFRLTPLAYRLIFVHALILMLGGHYTYAEVPLGFWMQRAFGFARNNYDKIGHLAQGFIPAIVTRELLVRRSPLRGSRWTGPLAVAVCLAISAVYELVEWAAAVALGQGADAFLGTQGDPWDTQTDMLCALIGASVALLALSRVHARQVSRIEGPA